MAKTMKAAEKASEYRQHVEAARDMTLRAEEMLDALYTVTDEEIDDTDSDFALYVRGTLTYVFKQLHASRVSLAAAAESK